MLFSSYGWFKPPWELLYNRNVTPGTLKAVRVALVEPVACFKSLSQAERYEIQQTGPENIQVQGGGEQVWADGIRPSDSKLLDAKYVRNPDNSPYVPDSNMDEDIRAVINTKTDNEFRRYGAVINDPNTPVTGLEVITNEPRAVPYFQNLMTKYNIPGHVVVQP